MPTYIDADSIPTYIRAMGVPESVSDEQLSFHIRAAARRYSDIRPLYAIKSIEVTPGTQDYALDDNWIGVKEVLYNPSGPYSLPSYWMAPPVWWRLGAGEVYVFDQPSLGFVWMAQFKHLAEMFEGTWEVYESEDGNDYLRLIPSPRQKQSIKVLGRILRPEGKVREEDREIFYLCCAISIYRSVAGGSGVAQQFSDSGMNIDIGGGARLYMDMANNAEQRLIELCGTAPVIRSG